MKTETCMKPQWEGSWRAGVSCELVTLKIFFQRTRKLLILGCDVTPFSLENRYQCFGEMLFLHFQGGVCFCLEEGSSKFL